MSTVTGDDTLYQQAQDAATVQSKTVNVFVGLSIDCQAALHLLQSLIAHPHHQYAESTLALTAAPFDESVVKLIDYRQMADTTLLHLARMHDMKLGHVRSGCCSHLSREQKSSITHAVNLDFHVGDFGWACCNYP